MNNEFNPVLNEFKKGGTRVFIAVFSCIAISILLSHLLETYFAIPSKAYGVTLSVAGILTVYDRWADANSLQELQLYWIGRPMTIHVWLIIDCVAYYFLLRSYLHEMTIWQNLSNKLQ